MNRQGVLRRTTLWGVHVVIVVTGLVLIALPLVSPHREPVKIWVPPHGYRVVSVPNTHPDRIVRNV